MRVALGGIVAIALILLVVQAFVPFALLQSTNGNEATSSSGLLDRIPRPNGLPFGGSGDNPVSVDIGSIFLAAAAGRLGLSDLPPTALPAAARAYRNQFGHGMDQDLPEYQEDVEKWLAAWRMAYNAGLPWATGMAAQPQPPAQRRAPRRRRRHQLLASE